MRNAWQRIFGERLRLGVQPVSLIGLAFFCAYIVVIVLVFRDYGITWDEEVQADYGEYNLRWYRTFFREREFLTYYNLRYYGGLFDMVAQAAWRISGLGKFETRHLVNACFGALGVLGTYRLGAHLRGGLAGLLAGMFVVLTPAYFGHSFNNPKDIPFAAFFVCSVYFIGLWLSYLPRVPRSLVLKLGVAIGLTMGVRVGGIVLLGMLALGTLLWLLGPGRHHPTGGADDWATWVRERVFPLCLRFAATAGVAYAVMLPWWPAAQLEPLVHPLRTLLVTSRFPAYTSPVFFEGRELLPTELPWYAGPKLLLLMTPEFVLLGLLLAVGYGAARVVRRAPTQRTSRRTISYVIVGSGVVFPLAYAAVAGGLVFDGLRHFLFIVPLVNSIAAVGIAEILRRPSWIARGVAGIVAGLAVWTALDMIRLHPHQYVYFNRLLAGGLRGASSSYEVDYWGNSYKEGAEWVVQHYGANGPPIMVGTCSVPIATFYYMPARFVGAPDPDTPPDVFLAGRRFNCNDRFDGPVVHVVERQGVPLLFVKDLRHGNANQRPVTHGVGQPQDGKEQRALDGEAH